MKRRENVYLVLLLSAVILAGCKPKESPLIDPPASADPAPKDMLSDTSAQAPASGGYALSCDAADRISVKGYVANRGADTYQLSGIVVFNFSNSPSPRSPVQVTASVMVGPHQTVLAAEAHPAFQLAPGETCQFDPGSAIKRMGP